VRAEESAHEPTRALVWVSAALWACRGGAECVSAVCGERSQSRGAGPGVARHHWRSCHDDTCVVV
jgi:hypothetical protein